MIIKGLVLSALANHQSGEVCWVCVIIRWNENHWYVDVYYSPHHKRGLVKAFWYNLHFIY